MKIEKIERECGRQLIIVRICSVVFAMNNTAHTGRLQGCIQKKLNIQVKSKKIRVCVIFLKKLFSFCKYA